MAAEAAARRRGRHWTQPTRSRRAQSERADIGRMPLAFGGRWPHCAPVGTKRQGWNGIASKRRHPRWRSMEQGGRLPARERNAEKCGFQITASR